MNKPNYICTECGIFYGNPTKTLNGYCQGCWNLWVKLQEQNIRKSWVEWCTKKGWKPNA